MSEKTSNSSAAAASGAATRSKTTGPVAEKVSIGEFCTRLSESENRVSLIGGFEHCEKLAGRTKDTAEAYSERFAAYVSKPII